MSGGGSSTLLECIALEAGYGPGPPVLHSIDLTVDRGEVVALLGTNGAGKSTLAKTISQIVRPSSGSIIFDGADVTHIGPLEATRRGIVHVPGTEAVFPTLTVADHFRLASFACRDATVHEQQSARVLDGFPALRLHWHDSAGDLSGGEQRQLAVAIGLVASPDLLLIDELSLGLAKAVIDHLLELVSTISAGGCAVVIVDQSVDVAVRVADRAYFMERGEIRFRGHPGQLLDRPDLVRAVFLGTARTGPGHREGVGAPPSAAATASTLSVRKLTKRFRGIAAVDDVSFEVPPGAVIGLVGPNGAGKTTVIDLVCGLERPDHGTIELGSVDITRLNAHRRALLGLGRSFQDARLFPALTLAENVAVAFEAQLDVRDHVSSMLALPAARAMERELALQVDALIERFRLDRWCDEPVSELSPGTRRVVELAMVLAHRPRVLLLDEPSAGLASAEVDALLTLLRQVRDETSCSMVLVEHDLSLVRSLADTVVVMDRGRVVARRAPDTERG